MALEPGLMTYKKPVPRKYRARLLDLQGVAALRAELKRLRVDPGGAYIMQTKGISKLLLLESISPKAANIIKQEALARGGDLAVSWQVADFDPAPTDVLLMGSLTFYRVLVEKLLRQSVFDLQHIGREIDKTLTAAVPGYRAVTLQRPRVLPLPGRELELGRRTCIMGILNLTDDSFTGDGIGRQVGKALDRARQMTEDGADIIDVGGESSERRDHSPLNDEEELAAVLPVVRLLRQELPAAVISIDTWKARVAAACLEAGAHLINDVGAMRRDPDMRRVIAGSAAPIVVMHSQAGTAYQDIMTDIYHFFCDVLEEAAAAGISEEQIVVDAGFGFGKSVHQDLLVTRRLRELASLGRPILHAPSRKRTIGRVLGYPDSVEERLLGTAAAVAVGIQNGADIVRVHDVREMARCAKMTDALVRGYDGPDE
ncbi:MAG: dihydropteroate synthase [Symbiobacteriia bacterium]